MPTISRTLALGALLAALPSCSADEPKPWNPAELDALTEEFVHIAEAYAVVDRCMPMIDADADARYRLTSKIDVRRYTQLQNMKTEIELARFYDHHRGRGGSEEQYEAIDRAYRAAYEEAIRGLRSVELCVETVSDYANTILRTNVQSLR